ncbi:helix-turn-helix domain-containing protein [Bosea sp. TAF32]|uniref:helix-turn-helix domain-containing protein n=1 Tax=Bosea sp. TAF32 TaxID=3237482 RepID=UPI003F92FF21
MFEDLGVNNAEEHLAKADLVSKIASVIETRGLTQVEAARLIGLPQPKVSLLVRGIFRDFSTERLCRILNRLGVTVSMVLIEEPDWRPGMTTVSEQEQDSDDLFYGDTEQSGPAFSL